jgi:hypothetical protein
LLTYHIRKTQNRTTSAGQLDYSTVSKGLFEQDSQYRTNMTGQCAHDSKNRTVGKESWGKSVGTGQPGQDSCDRRDRHDGQNRTVRKRWGGGGPKSWEL